MTKIRLLHPRCTGWLWARLLLFYFLCVVDIGCGRRWVAVWAICPIHFCPKYLSYIFICPILVVVEGSSGWRCGPFVLILPPHTSPTPCGNISPKYHENFWDILIETFKRVSKNIIYKFQMRPFILDKLFTWVGLTTVIVVFRIVYC